jgi:hypothetical protein
MRLGFTALRRAAVIAALTPLTAVVPASAVAPNGQIRSAARPAASRSAGPGYCTAARARLAAHPSAGIRGVQCIRGGRIRSRVYLIRRTP